MPNRAKNIVRWEILAGAVAVSLAAFVYFAHVPAALSAWESGKALYERYRLADRADTFPAEIESVQRQAEMLDSLVQVLGNRDTGGVAGVAGLLYSLADSAKIRTAKLEMGNAAKVGKVSEVPVIIKGGGTYNSVGTFISLVENSETPTRMRQLVLKNSGDGSVEMNLEFVLISQGEEEGQRARGQ